ncbi:MAG: methylated-DNA--[protein]-cysteine S-methyltransferase [Acidobacteria bacterium]|nr:methylated-DNA--[protein]-cysteine S-methyltransferase [Acidobacteriota bacterium]
MPIALSLTIDRLPSPIGMLLLICDEEGVLRGLHFDGDEARMRQQLSRQYGEGGYSLTSGSAPTAITKALEAYLAGDITAVDDIPVRADGTDFQRRVWAALRRIPAGTTTTYGQIAAQIGQPTAVRAVGLANGSNPIGIVVPCHRVVGANGTLTGYAGGLERKRWLLDHEQYRATTGVI